VGLFLKVGSVKKCVWAGNGEAVNAQVKLRERTLAGFLIAE